MGDDLTLFLENFIKKEPIFDDKKALQSNYTPINVPYRNKQIQQIAGIFAPALRLEKPSNLFIYGKTGTGKTVSVKHTTNTIMEIANRNNLPLKVIYINCKLKRVADTEYRLVAQLAYEFGKDVPATGLPTDEVYKIFLKVLDSEKKVVILILDEIDQLVNKVGDGILYNLTRINSELKNSQISIIGISNDLMFADNIDPRVKSSLSEEELVFPPYNAIQLQKILRERAKIAFRGGVVAEGVIEKCAAYAARDHGDARRALELLRVAGEVADRKNFKKIGIPHIDEAEEKIDRDRIIDIATTQPKQYQLVLYAILALNPTNNKSMFTGEVYEIYKTICNKINISILTQRRVSDIISEFDMLGIVNAKVISKGRYGRTRDISVDIPESTLAKLKAILEDNIHI